MTEQTELHRMKTQLASLERRIKRMQVCCITILSMGLLVFVFGAAPQEMQRDVKFGKVEATEIVVRNKSGDSLHIWASDGTTTGVALDLTRGEGQSKRVLARIADFGGSGQISVNDLDDRNSVLILTDEEVAPMIAAGGGKGPGLVVRGAGPFISLQDRRKYSMLLGSSALLASDGSETNTSAASIHLFDDKGKVSWQAPPK